MNSKDISILLKKADELRSLFVLGQRVIPFLEEIFVFVQDIQPMLEEINISIDENIQKMPGASEKLSKVTEANELATTEIMDTLDKIFSNTDKLSKNNKEISSKYSDIIDKPLRLLEILRRGIDNGGDLKKALPQIDNAIAKIKSFDKSKISPLEEANSKIIDDINNDASAIMMSLQVQDITSQQIAAVDHMLNAIQGKLAEILTHFKNTDVTSLVDADANDKKKEAEEDSLKTNSSQMHREIAFDPNAISSYDDNKKRQEEIDKIINESSGSFDDDEDQASDVESSDTEIEDTSNEDSEGAVDLTTDFDPSNPDDIDAMFNSNSSDDSKDNEESEAVTESELDSTDDNTSDTEEGIVDFTADFDPSNPDDIDAMFNSNVSEDPEESEESLDTANDDSLDSEDESTGPEDIDDIFANQSENESDEEPKNKGESDSSASSEMIEESEEDASVSQDQDDVDKMFAEMQKEEKEPEEDKESEEENKKEDEDFDLSKFDELGDNPDPDDIDALFNGG